MEFELRRNRVREGFMEEFLEAWLSQVPALRARFGFEIVGAWVSDDSSEFVWMLGFDGQEGFDVADAQYYASPERAALNPDPAQWFESAEHVRLRSIM
jgi:hypothetical protein